MCIYCKKEQFRQSPDVWTCIDDGKIKVKEECYHDVCDILELANIESTEKNMSMVLQPIYKDYLLEQSRNRFNDRLNSTFSEFLKMRSEKLKPQKGKSIPELLLGEDYEEIVHLIKKDGWITVSLLAIIALLILIIVTMQS